MKEKLIPVDTKRCQAEVESYNAWILGGSCREITRCERKPVENTARREYLVLRWKMYKKVVYRHQTVLHGIKYYIMCPGIVLKEMNRECGNLLVQFKLDGIEITSYFNIHYSNVVW